MRAPLDPPRFKGCPPICRAKNLPRHASEAHAKTFLRRFAPSCHVLEILECRACGGWHTYCVPPDPAGSSSGTGRFAKFYA